MAKDSDKRRGSYDAGDGAVSGLLADEEELDRGALWRLGTWAAVSVGAVIVALIANQSSIGVRRDQSASADLLKQAQQLQLTAKESQNETRRLSSAIDTLNGDRDRLYSRVAVLEQGLDSVTGAIARQPSVPPASTSGGSPANPSQASNSQPGTGQVGQGSVIQGTATQAVANATPPAAASAAPLASTSSPSTAQIASPTTTAPTTTASIEPSAPAVKPSVAPAVAPVAATTPAVTEKAAAAPKQDKQAPAASSSEPSPSAKPAPEQQSAQPSGSLMASKSMMGPPDPAAGKLIEPAGAKAVTAAPLPEVAAIAPTSKPADEAESAPAASPPELVASRTEFGVDVGGANSISGLRALWRGLLKSRSNGALSKLRPVIVIKENNNGLGMQLRLVAGPIIDAAAAAKVCASLTIADRGCSTAVFEGQRLALGADEGDKAEASKPENVKPEGSDKPTSGASKPSSRRHYYSYSSRRPKVEDPPPPPKPEQSTLSSMIFGKRQ